MNKYLLEFLNTIVTIDMEWELIKTFSNKYNQLYTVFENGWGVSVVFEDDGCISLETSRIEEDFYIYNEFDTVYDLLIEFMKIKEY